jgi:glyoxylase-like metal-dependent hydrolase (beta-lactamase superfamily II)
VRGDIQTVDGGGSADPTRPVRVGTLQRLTPEIRRLTQDNPGPFTGQGTNSYLIGRAGQPQIVLDPGEDREDGHLERLLEAIGDDPVAAVLISHAHPDHWPLAPRLAARRDAPIVAFDARAGLSPDRRLDEGDALEAGDLRLRALHTPGHASDHLCFLVEGSRILFCADHVMGWSTTVIAPPDGDLRAYMATLDRLLALDVDLFLPGHGDAIREPRRRVAELRDHRNQRTAQLIGALREAPGTLAELVARVYTDVDPRLHGAARMSLLAHLEALVADQRVSVSVGDRATARYRWRGEPPSR